MEQHPIRMSSGRIKNAARSIGVRGQVSGIRKLECGMRKIRKTAGRMLSIKSDSFRARPRPRNQDFIGAEGRVRGRRRGRSPYSVTRVELNENHIGFHEASYKGSEVEKFRR